MIFMHHPPFATGIGFMDRVGCANGDRLAALVAAHARCSRCCCGHVHRAVARLGGTVGSICPSVAWAVPLHVAARKPRLGAARGSLRWTEPPAFHTSLDPGCRLVTRADVCATPAWVETHTDYVAIATGQGGSNSDDPATRPTGGLAAAVRDAGP